MSRKIITFLLLLVFLVLFSRSFFKNKTKEKALEDNISMLSHDVDFLINHIEYLELQKDTLQFLYEFEKQNIKTITKIQIKETIINKIDTVMVFQEDYNINKIYSVPFDITERMDGSIYNITGFSQFKWDFNSNNPISPVTTITSFNMRLNVRTNLLETREYYEIYTQPFTPNIIITENQNNILTEKDYIKKIPSKFSIGVIAGYGFTYKGLSPYVGVGVSYNFYDFNKLIQKIRR